MATAYIANSKSTPLATVFATAHRSNFNVPKLISKLYTNERHCTLKGKLCTQTLVLNNHIASLCSHDVIKTDKLTYVHAGVIDWST